MSSDRPDLYDGKERKDLRQKHFSAFLKCANYRDDDAEELFQALCLEILEYMDKVGEYPHVGIRYTMRQRLIIAYWKHKKRNRWEDAEFCPDESELSADKKLILSEEREQVLAAAEELASNRKSVFVYTCHQEIRRILKHSRIGRQPRDVAFLMAVMNALVAGSVSIPEVREFSEWSPTGTPRIFATIEALLHNGQPCRYGVYIELSSIPITTDWIVNAILESDQLLSNRLLVFGKSFDADAWQGHLQGAFPSTQCIQLQADDYLTEVVPLAKSFTETRSRFLSAIRQQLDRPSERDRKAIFDAELLETDE